MSRHVKRSAAVLGAAAVAFFGTASAEAAQGRSPLLEAPIGFEVASPAEACAWSGREGEAPLPIVAGIDEASLRDPSSIDRLLDCAAERNLAVVARIEPPDAWARADDPYGALAPWIGDLERFLQPRRGRLRLLQMGAAPEDRFEPTAYAFLLERVATLAHSIDPGSALIVGAMGEGAAGWFAQVPPARIAPYIGGIALRDPVDLPGWMAAAARDHPGVPVWLQLEPGGAPGLIRRIHAARQAGVRMAVVSSATAPAAREVILNLVRALPSRFVADGDPPPLSGQGAPEVLAAFADPLGPERALLLSRRAGGAGSWRFTLGAAGVRAPHALDLGTGAELPVTVSLAGEATEFQTGPARGPLLLRFLLVKGLRAEPETVGVTAGYELTAAEIIALQRAFDATQARDLRHYMAKATLSYHFRAEALNETIDVASVNRFFWKEGAGEYEETELYVNGARWRGRPPSMPFIEPEKIKEVPIEIRLDASYTYRLAGRESLDGRPCYVVEFEPVGEGQALYSGRVWIDEETFARRRIHLVQHGLKQPITGNVDDLSYGWVEGPEGRHWLPVEGYRQMTFTVLGRTIVAERRVRWEEFAVNGPDFEERRDQAYGSGRPILRDDQQGTAFVLQDAAGMRTRQVRSSRNVALFGGMSMSPGEPLGTPFAALNYFDFDWRGSGTQLDVAFAGVFADIAWTDPALGKSRWEMTLEGRLIALPEKVKRATDAGLRDPEEVKVLEERAWFVLGRPVTPFSKVEFQIELGWDGYRLSGRTGRRMVLPASGLTTTGTLRWRYQRRGVLFDSWFSDGRRSGWEDWGYPGGSGGTADQDHFQRWGVGLLKSIYIGGFQKVSLGAAWYSGRDLDRFSRFRIGEFRSARVRGYNGADITFERGLTAQVNYQVPIPRGGVALDFSVDAAVIEDEEDFAFVERPPRGSTIRSGVPAGPDGFREYVVGGGVGVTFNGPWGTLMMVRGAWGLGSSMDLSGSVASMRLTIVKTYDRWPWENGRRGGPPAAPIP